MVGTTNKQEKDWPAIIRERVTAGIKLLDKERPGWQAKVDLELLDLRDPYHCIIGQVLPLGYNYSSAWHLGITQEQMTEHGFDFTKDAQGEDGFDWEVNNELPELYQLLTDEWRKQLSAKELSRVT